MTRRITLLTDFGTADGYVAAIKGVISAIAPAVPIDDAAHDIPPGDIWAAAWALARYWRFYPPETVHLVVVDPGVGGDRRPIVAEVDGRLFVAPDNGVLTRVLADVAPSGLFLIENERYRRPTVAATFHGRDLFAPAAAYLAQGIAPAELGPPISDPVLLPLREPVRSGNRAIGEVVHVDRFGNLITNLPAAWCRGAIEVRIAGRSVGPLRRTYVDAAPGELLALVGSADLVEVAARDASAAALLGVGRGETVIVDFGSLTLPGGASHGESD